MGFNEVFSNKHRVSQVLFVLIILYALGSVVCLFVAAGMPAMSEADRNYTMIAFSMLSFVLAIAISAYHLSTLLRRRKRVTDKTET